MNREVYAPGSEPALVWRTSLDSGVIGRMRRDTAIKQLRRLAELCGTAHLPPDEPVLLEAYAYGDILDPATDELDVVRVALVLDLPADEVTWLALPTVNVWLDRHLRLDSVPVRALKRPAVWPVWNHVIRRPVRIWSLEGGTDDAALAALTNRDVESLRLPAPSRDEEAEQLAEELNASLVHLRRVQDSYFEREWRSTHKGFGVYPEDHLWHAVEGYLDLLDANRKLAEEST